MGFIETPYRPILDGKKVDFDNLRHAMEIKMRKFTTVKVFYELFKLEYDEKLLKNIGTYLKFKKNTLKWNLNLKIDTNYLRHPAHYFTHFL